MKQILKKISTLFITLCMVLTLFPTIAFAETASEIADKIREINGLTATLSDGDKTVIVEGTAALSETLDISIPEDVTVVWKATVTPADGMGSTLISLSSGGTENGGIFEVAEGADLSTDKNWVISTLQCPIVVSGGIVSCDYDGTAKLPSAIYTGKSVTVNGGTVQHTGRGRAIEVRGDDATVTVNGGTVKNSGSGEAIYTNDFKNVDIVVSDGTVSTANGYVIFIKPEDSNSSLLVRGGEVKTTSATNAIRIQPQSFDCPVTVEGGTVSATTDAAIYNNSASPNVTVSGGTVFAYGTDISDVIDFPEATSGFAGATDDGVVIAWDKDKGITNYSSGSSDDLIVSPDTATVTWANQSGESGISYENGSVSGFLPIEGITVQDAPDANALKVKDDIEQYNTEQNGNLTASVEGNTVLVTGTAENVTSGLTLDIDAGIKVIWKATIIGGKNDIDYILIFLTGEGEFEVADGEISSLKGSIYANNAKVTVSGGMVSTQENTAIAVNGVNTELVVSGGVVSSQENNAIAVSYGASSSTVTVSGGVVRSNSDSVVHFMPDENTSSCAFHVSGGVIFGTAYSVADLKGHFGIIPQVSGNSIMIGWNNGATTYGSGESTDLYFLPDTATATWAKQGEESGISYTNGSNTGFISVEGVTITGEASPAVALKTALESTTAQTITVSENIELPSDVTVGANHTLNIADGCTLSTGAGSTLTISSNTTLTLTGTGTFEVNNSTVEKGVDVQGTLESNSTNIIVANKFGANGETDGILFGSGAQMLVHGGSLEVSNSCYNGIKGDGMLTVDGNCQVMVKNVPGSAGGSTIGLNTNLTLKNSTIQVQNTSDAGVIFSEGMQLTMENAVINVANNGDLAFLNMKIDSDTNSKIIFAEGATLYIEKQMFSNRGYLTNTGFISVGAEDSAPSTEGLTAGEYIWNGSVFAKANLITPVSGVTLNKTALSLYSNTSTKTAALTATINPANATDQSVTWESSNTSVATVDAKGLVTAVGNGSAVITVTTTDGGYTASCTVTVTTYSSGGSHSGGGSSSGGGSITSATPATSVSGSTAMTETKAETNADGKATASVTQSQMNSAMEEAQKAAEKTGEKPKVDIEVSGTSNAKEVKTTLANASVQKLAKAGIDSLAISSSVAEMTFDGKALDKIASQTSGDVSFGVSKVDNSALSEAAKKIVGDRSVYDFTVISGDKKITEFDGTVTVSISYKPAEGENPNAIVVYYINADGEPEIIQNCRYDAKHGVLVFTTTHFSVFAVGYQKVTFDDVEDSVWYADAVTFLAARKITGGTTKTMFGPNEILTRGQFVTLLMRAYNIQPDDDSNDNFSDAGDTYYTDYLAAAKRLGISGGMGENKFAPEQAITRQQMFTLLYNALKAIDQLPEGDSERALTDFTDYDSISSYGEEAMAYFVEIGAVSGTNGKLLPEATTTRGEMAQVLYNLLAK
ncbi:S-layer homology domain-containing protein [Anaerotignum sp.]|uniref:S-layer homology domain-containing protein n=1 Tax=Anaerotignum sp. TaxID=2039241 RepID=UPI0027150171|nr:S-layer homology domain-containing protein [Anaerotignum sp.]